MVVMRDIIQKASNTDKQITLALLRSVWLSYLLSIGSTSAGTLSIFSVAAILGSQSAQANFSEQPASFPDQPVEKEPVIYTSQDNPALSQPSQTIEDDHETIADTTSRQPSETLNLSVSDGSEHQLPVQLAVGEEPTPIPSAIAPKPPVVEPVQNGVEHSLPVNLAAAEEPTPIPSAIAPKPPVMEPVQNAVEHQLPFNLAVIGESTTIPSALVPKPPLETPEQHSVKTLILAQTSEENAPDPSLIPQNAPPKNEALTPTLDVQGVYLNQGDDAARLRLRGIYPVSPNALFGAIVDLATGNDFAGTEGSGLNLTELYFTGSLPSYSNLRLTVGLMDLTSYFDRNSFAKDSTTHFFHPLFQTNPALASAGIGSRPGVLLNWNITDNVEAKATVFSSERNLGSFSLDAFAGEIGFRAGNAIIRATYASDKDTGRDGVFGTRNGDREHAFGINGELYIPQIKMGLFARYGWFDNRDRDKNTETYNFGLNFLDLFIKDDRLGLGYAFGRDFSKDNDVWELFYDLRVARNLRAGVTLQEREGFSETIFGFRVKTDLPLYP